MRRHSLALALASAALLASGAGCSFILDFDAPVVARDTGPRIPDAAVFDVVLPPDAGRDNNESNDDMATATILPTPSTYDGLTIFPIGDQDFFRFSLDAPHEVAVEIRFIHFAGDLELELLDSMGGVKAFSRGLRDNEHIPVVDRDAGIPQPDTILLDTGDWFIHVWGSGNTIWTNTYSLVLTVK